MGGTPEKRTGRLFRDGPSPRLKGSVFSPWYKKNERFLKYHLFFVHVN